jgi:hypothetical protein
MSWKIPHQCIEKREWLREAGCKSPVGAFNVTYKSVRNARWRGALARGGVERQSARRLAPAGIALDEIVEHGAPGFEPLHLHFERDPIPYALETDWPVGAAGVELPHLE